MLDLPFLACPSEHERRWCSPTFGEDLASTVVDGLPRAGRGCAPRRRVRCRRCRADLPAAAQALERFGVPVSLAGAPPFRLEVEAAGYTCPRCGERQLGWRPAEERACFAAVAEAVFEHARLEP